MALNYFMNALDNGMTPKPNELYHGLQQAFITEQWDNTTALYCLLEQDMNDAGEFPTFTFHETEAWLNYVVGMTSTGVKNGDDFRQLLFESLDHPCVRGRYYKFENNYWIGDFTDKHASVDKNMTIRRCNNYMRIVDPENGSIYQIPCVVDYDMSSPSMQVTSHILTPNNHATIMVQGNPDTLCLFQTNTRYILGSRPFKLAGYQNAMQDDYTSPMPTLLYLDLYLDEIHANDDLDKQIADNGVYDYDISINSENMELAVGSGGSLSADVTLNGQEVNRTVEWSTSNKSVVTIDGLGAYQVVGVVGASATITATLQGNTNVSSTILISVVDVADIQPTIILNPAFKQIREYETINLTLSAFYNGNDYTPAQSSLSLSENEQTMNNEYLSIVKNGNEYELKCLKRTNTPQILYYSVSNNAPVFEASGSQAVQCVSMMG